MKTVKVMSVITTIAFCVMLLSSFRVALSDADAEAEADENNVVAGNNKREFPVKMKWQDFMGSTRKYAEIMRYVVSQVKDTIFPPNLDLKKPNEAEPITSTGIADGGAGEKMKMAAGKSFKATKDAVEESAKSFANVIGEAVHKTTEKVKKITPTTSSSTSESHTDL